MLAKCCVTGVTSVAMDCKCLYLKDKALVTPISKSILG